MLKEKKNNCDGDMSKRHRNQMKELSTVKAETTSATK